MKKKGLKGKKIEEEERKKQLQKEREEAYFKKVEAGTETRLLAKAAGGGNACFEQED